MLVTGLTILLSLLLPLFGNVDPQATRQYDLVRIQHALDVHEGVAGFSLSSNKVEEKLSSMSDEEVKEFADSLEATHHTTDPMVVVIASIVMLMLVVGLIVRLVD